MRDEVLFSCNWDFQNPLKFSESSEIFSFLQNSEIFKFAEGNTELLPVRLFDLTRNQGKI